MDNALILIAEDDADIAQILTAFRDCDGFRTVCAGDGEVAPDASPHVASRLGIA